MTQIRKEIWNILLFTLWIGLATSVTTANAEVAMEADTNSGYTIDLAFFTHLDASSTGLGRTKSNPLVEVGLEPEGAPRRFLSRCPA